MGDWKKVLDFIVKPENIIILLILNPKPSSYWEKN